ncbi:MAG: deoxyribonuclease IV [Lachnospiraceae bacterium]|uniref:deoxyribonuclease IV n=1 Tax=Galactobacillus timonensis TaxID=2041840 RepID=UPI0023F4FA5B|nr:deoxyribonuclease IV [Galactobacillus timonensis]MCI6753710.1 deoxyribonuclease IV [Galactobacillus timonensis]MDD7086146.1 deoxyribonuclease IV [Galactobacillus timonensis]MDY5221850.1 deoxyribonuclease IV [Lachnospiraceae bacterium]
MERKTDLLIGSHVRMTAPGYFEGAVQELLSYDANAGMLYTGAPQNSVRVPMERMRIEEGKELLRAHQIPLKNIVVHAPYIINPGSLDPEKRDFAVSFLSEEMKRAAALGVRDVVLHPGSYTTGDPETGIRNVIGTLNRLEIPEGIVIALETMAGSGSQIGRTLEELAGILDGVKAPEHFAVCLDTCHMFAAGYDVSDADRLLAGFDHVLGLKLLHVIHLNDSKEPFNSHKDRHANLGRGMIGFAALNAIAHHPLTSSVVKILETPYIDGKPPYREEIAEIRRGCLDPN